MKVVWNNFDTIKKVENLRDLEFRDEFAITRKKNQDVRQAEGR